MKINVFCKNLEAKRQEDRAYIEKKTLEVSFHHSEKILYRILIILYIIILIQILSKPKQKRTTDLTRFVIYSVKQKV